MKKLFMIFGFGLVNLTIGLFAGSAIAQWYLSKMSDKDRKEWLDDLNKVE